MQKDKNLFLPKPFQTKKDVVLQVVSETELMRFLIENLKDKSRDNVKTLLRDRQIQVDGKVQTQYNFLLKTGQKVTVRWAKIPEEKSYRGISIIYEDEYLIVIDKHAGVLSMSDGGEKGLTAYNMLSHHVKIFNPENKIFIVHRLDRDTSGLMMFAKSDKVQEVLQKNWDSMIIEKTYLAVVEGDVLEKSGTIESYLKENKAMIVYSTSDTIEGQKAITHFEVLRSNGRNSLLKITIETGRKNQIRVHMKDIGHPVVGDKKYGAKTSPIQRVALHSWILKFQHPAKNEIMNFETPVPRKFTRLV